MIIWINGAFGSGKTTTAFELHRRLENSFVYDPENVGYFIRRNSPPMFSEGDFQDFPLWREMSLQMLRLIISRYDGTLIVPMTLVNPDYYAEIVTTLQSEGVELHHFILSVTKKNLLKRLRSRNITGKGRDSFAIRSIDRCLYAFRHHIKETKVAADSITVDEIVEEIAAACGLKLKPDHRSPLKRKADRMITLLRHIH